MVGEVESISGNSSEKTYWVKKKQFEGFKGALNSGTVSVKLSAYRQKSKLPFRENCRGFEYALTAEQIREFFFSKSATFKNSYLGKLEVVDSLTLDDDFEQNADSLVEQDMTSSKSLENIVEKTLSDSEVVPRDRHSETPVRTKILGELIKQDKEPKEKKGRSNYSKRQCSDGCFVDVASQTSLFHHEILSKEEAQELGKVMSGAVYEMKKVLFSEKSITDFMKAELQKVLAKKGKKNWFQYGYVLHRNQYAEFREYVSEVLCELSEEELSGDSSVLMVLPLKNTAIDFLARTLLRSSPAGSFKDLKKHYDVYKDALEELVLRNAKFIAMYASKYQSKDLPFADLFQEGSIGAMHAAGTYDYNLGNAFTTHAGWWIQQGMKRAISIFGSTVRIAHDSFIKNKLVQKVKSDLVNESDFEPSEEQIVAVSGVTRKEYERMRHWLMSSHSLDSVVAGDRSRYSSIADKNIATPLQYLERKELNVEVARLLKSLTEIESGVIKKRFGIETGFEQDIASIGSEYGLSRREVRRIELEALVKLRSISKQGHLQNKYSKSGCNDPLQFYRTHHAGLTRGELRIIDQSLYRELLRNNLLSKIPLKEYSFDPFGFYEKNYAGLTRHQVRIARPGLYYAIKRAGFLDKLPIHPIAEKYTKIAQSD